MVYKTIILFSRKSCYIFLTVFSLISRIQARKKQHSVFWIKTEAQPTFSLLRKVLSAFLRALSRLPKHVHSVSFKSYIYDQDEREGGTYHCIFTSGYIKLIVFSVSSFPELLSKCLQHSTLKHSISNAQFLMFSHRMFKCDLVTTYCSIQASNLFQMDLQLLNSKSTPYLKN